MSREPVVKTPCRSCPTCGGTGLVEVTGIYAETLAAVVALGEGVEVTGAELARLIGIKETTANNRLDALDGFGLLTSRRYGRRRLFRLRPTNHH